VTRQFTSSPGKRSRVPLFIGIAGPSSSGKTFSALRLATGIQRTAPGEVFVIDTEAGRALHYADQFKFQHTPFDPPFGPLAYLDAIRHCVKSGASVVVIDSASHLHEGEGGLLDMHETEMDRMAGPAASYERREQMKWAAWIKPKQEMKRFIQCLLQMNTNIIFCFRARDKVKPVQGGKPLELGFSAIAGDDLIYEMTAQALLLPGARGVPSWTPKGGKSEQLQTKLPGQFIELLKASGPLSEDMGELMGRWAAGDAPAVPRERQSERPPPAAGAPELTVAEALRRIAACKTVEALDALREALATASANWNDADQATGRKAFRSRKSELS
jgi:hypothetical protein